MDRSVRMVDSAAPVGSYTLNAPRGIMRVDFFRNDRIEARHDCHTSPEDPATMMRVEHKGDTTTLYCPECGITVKTRSLQTNFIETLNKVSARLLDAEFSTPADDTR